jgi:hypothetical protein
MMGLVQIVDKDNPRWQTWRRSFSVRVIEFHEYRKGGGLAKKFHFDEGSCYTMVIMMSCPNTDFQGGEFQTWEANNRWEVYDLQQGDCLVIPSCKFHSVARLTEGKREVVVMEVWDGPEGVTDTR